jgi:predicted nucleotidyltransferase
MIPITPADQNLAMLQVVAAALGPLRESLVFVGGCATGLLVTNVRSQPIRSTNDVDLIAHVVSQNEYHSLERQFESLGFQHDIRVDAPICRWVRGDVTVDLMPTSPEILGFRNRWYPLAVESAKKVPLADGKTINLISAPVFIATKIEAFKGRGNDDYTLSHDLEDIITIVDGRDTLLDEANSMSTELRNYLGEEFRALLATRDFIDALPGQLSADRGSQARLPGLKRKLQVLASLK